MESGLIDFRSDISDVTSKLCDLGRTEGAFEMYSQTIIISINIDCSALPAQMQFFLVKFLHRSMLSPILQLHRLYLLGI